MTCGKHCSDGASIFDEQRARRDIESYRHRGPAASTVRLLAALRAADLRVDTLLDVGGGVGTIAHELLKGDVRQATLVESSLSYLAAARAESDRRSTSDRLQLQVGDLVEIADDVPLADVVTLDKVVCCYEDMESLIAVSAAHARRLYGIVYPRDGWWVRLAITVENRMRRYRGGTFRNFVHPNVAIEAALHRAGLAPRFRRRGAWWVIAVYERQAASTTWPVRRQLQASG
jgi:magnesium-protoporphyrin O-methyltransferase